MADEEGIAPDGAIADTEAQENAEETPQSEVGEAERLKQELEQTRKQLEFEKKARADENRFITRMSQESQGVEMASTKIKQDILAQATDGTLDTSRFSVKQQLDQVDTAADKARQKLKVEASTYQTTNELFNVLRQAGYDPMAQTLPPEVLEIQREYNEVIREGGSLEGVMTKAKALTAQKPQVKEPEKTEPAKEAPKKSLKVDTGTPSAPLANWRNMTTEEKMRLGLEQLKKNKR